LTERTDAELALHDAAVQLGKNRAALNNAHNRAADAMIRFSEVVRRTGRSSRDLADARLELTRAIRAFGDAGAEHIKARLKYEAARRTEAD
jgi:hypothetical protein